MNDPIVKSLEYKLETDETLSFDAPPLSLSTDDFELKLQNDVLKIKLIKEFSSIKDARNFIEKFLEAWKVKTELQYGINTISFKYVDAEVIDRSPPKSGESFKMTVNTARIVVRGGNVTFRTTKNLYPEPPVDFELSPDVKTLWYRYKNYKNDNESIFSMAYFCYTVLKQYGKDASISKRFNISRSILKNVRELSSTKGDIKSARKYTAINLATSTEIKWLEHAIREIIKQLAIYDEGKSPKILKMDDLPTLRKT